LRVQGQAGVGQGGAVAVQAVRRRGVGPLSTPGRKVPGTAPPRNAPSSTSTSPPPIGGLLAEGWNKGWDGSWADQDFTTPADDFDLEAVVAYGRSKHVEFVAHNETGANLDNYEAQLDAAFALYERLGIHYL
jgi:hypothetical protein